jgi:hypothetical protein
MPISRSELLKELLPGLKELFDVEYRNYGRERRYERNRQIHGLEKVNKIVIELGSKKPSENHTKGSSV